MKRALFFFFVAFLCPIFLKAQANYKPGVVVTLEGDTLRGYINYKEWEYTPSAVTFKEDLESGGEKVLDATNTSYFEITGLEAYQRYEGPITMNPIAIDRISFQAKPLLEPAVIFLKVNYKGDLVDLLSYSDKIKTRLFFQEKDGSQPQELYYNRYYTTSNSSQIMTQKGFVGQLQYLANKYIVTGTAISREIENSQYTEGDLENIFRKLNQADKPDLTHAESKKSSIRYFGGVGLSSSTIRTMGIEEIENPDSNPASFMPVITFGFDSFLNKNIQKLYFRVEGAITAASYLIEKEQNTEYRYRHYSYKISQQTLSVNPQVIYSLYNKDNFKFHVGVIGQISFSNYSERNFRIQQQDRFANSSDKFTESNGTYLRLMPFWFTYAFRAGAIVNKRVEVYATYAPYRAITEYLIYKIEVQSLKLGVNYIFQK